MFSDDRNVVFPKFFKVYGINNGGIWMFLVA